MSRRYLGSKLAAIAICATLLLVLAPATAAGQARTTAAKPWDPPRTPDGQPNIQGHWETSVYAQDLETGINDEVTALIQGDAPPDRSKEVSVVIDPPNGKIPYQPWAAARRLAIPSHRRGDASRGTATSVRDLRPRTFCLHGTPRSMLQDFQVVQSPGYVFIFWPFNHQYRVIPLDNRAHVPANVKLVMGDARGRWEGNTLVVETTNLNDWDWFDYTGTFHAEGTSLVERFTIVDADNIHFQFTVTNPKVFTRPWTVAVPLKRLRRPADYEMWEEACVEGERGVEAILGKDPRRK